VVADLAGGAGPGGVMRRSRVRAEAPHLRPSIGHGRRGWGSVLDLPSAKALISEIPAASTSSEGPKSISGVGMVPRSLLKFRPVWSGSCGYGSFGVCGPVGRGDQAGADDLLG